MFNGHLIYKYSSHFNVLNLFKILSNKKVELIRGKQNSIRLKNSKKKFQFQFNRIEIFELFEPTRISNSNRVEFFIKK